MNKSPSLTHLREDGSAAMVDISGKPIVRRGAVAEGFISLESSTLSTITDGQLPKGDVLAVSRVAGIQAAKKTAELIPLCHQLPLTKVTVDFNVESAGIRITATARTDAKTGVEMEALSAVSIAALTIYDMCKAIDKSMSIQGIKLVEKTKEAVTT
ncbi:MAG: cyclic pyranopterin monophosphate synthase MoaC [Verrucomicrobiales bacterium]|jgi:cyclic pyranopterin phosphate synthase|nr:cyclic pyranopterin monophosphate synthase MoaC [Verrucomicrobiales bacterium]|tara:strand:- start:19153 stop:19620 length:468 start_codon:yes stop_codon:yes gene_type:complete